MNTRDLMYYLGEMAEAYIECALWSSTDESREDGGNPMDENYTADDVHQDTKLEMLKDCADFLCQAYETLQVAGVAPSQAGHDFWLTRNGHGAGFWDRGLGEAGDVLSEIARNAGSYDLYVGDDGGIYGA